MMVASGRGVAKCINDQSTVVIGYTCQNVDSIQQCQASIDLYLYVHRMLRGLREMEARQ
jgi:hypothetical protein